MSDNTVLDLMREQFARLHQRMDTSDRKLSEVVQRLGVLEVTVAQRMGAVEIGLAGLSVRLDNVAARLDRIERRQGLIEEPSS
jgi:hypothetical protein